MKALLDINTGEVFFGEIDKNLEGVEGYNLVEMPSNYKSKKVKFNTETKKIELDSEWLKEKKFELKKKLGKLLDEKLENGFTIEINGELYKQKCRTLDIVYIMFTENKFDKGLITEYNNYKLFNINDENWTYLSLIGSNFKDLSNNGLLFVSSLFNKRKEEENKIDLLTIDNIDEYTPSLD